MRYAITLAFVLLLVVLAAQISSAQEFTFRGSDVIQLARTIATQATSTNQLPSAYNLRMANGHVMTITAPNAFELLTRATVAWKDTGNYPATVPLLISELTISAPDPTMEPKRAGERIPVFSAEIGEKAHFWLQLAEAPAHKMFSVMKFGESEATSYRLTAAQMIVAMAVLTDEAVRDFEHNGKKEVPLAVAVPLVRSPQDWTDTRNAVNVGTPAAAPDHPDPVLIQPDLRITVQGIELSDRGPNIKNSQPFCGSIRIEMNGYGPIAKIRLLLDGDERKTFDGVGPHLFNINTLTLPDGAHVLTLNATDTEGKTHLYVYSFPISNGRESGFTPAE